MHVTCHTTSIARAQQLIKHQEPKAGTMMDRARRLVVSVLVVTLIVIIAAVSADRSFSVTDCGQCFELRKSLFSI